MTAYNEEEKRVLLAGMVGGRDRDAYWSKFPKAVQSLGDRGLVRMGHEMMANGTTTSFPLCLSPFGVLEAKRLQEVEVGQLI